MIACRIQAMLFPSSERRGQLAAPISQYPPRHRALGIVITRARDSLLVTGVEPASEFLDDLRM